MLTKQAVEYIKLGSGGSYSLSRDAIKHRIWDTRQFGATASDTTFFQQPNGATWRNGGNKSTNETNLFDSGKLPNGQTFLVNRFSVGLIVPVAADATNVAELGRAFNNLLQSSVFEIIIQGRAFDFQIHGSELLPRPISLYGQLATNAEVRIGDMLASGWAKLDPAPIFVDTLVSFQVNHRLNNPDPNVKTLLDEDATLLDGVYGSMICTLEGFLTRAK